MKSSDRSVFTERDVELSAMDWTLDRCPFCGSTGKVFRLQWFQIDCSECGLRDLHEIGLDDDAADHEPDEPELSQPIQNRPAATSEPTRTRIAKPTRSFDFTDQEPERQRRLKREFTITEACFDKLHTRGRGDLPKLIRPLLTPRHMTAIECPEQIPYGEPKRKVHMRFTLAELELLDSKERVHRRSFQEPLTRGEIVQALLEEFVLNGDSRK